MLRLGGPVLASGYEPGRLGQPRSLAPHARPHGRIPAVQLSGQAGWWPRAQVANTAAPGIRPGPFKGSDPRESNPDPARPGVLAASLSIQLWCGAWPGESAGCPALPRPCPTTRTLPVSLTRVKWAGLPGQRSAPGSWAGRAGGAASGAGGQASLGVPPRAVVPGGPGALPDVPRVAPHQPVLAAHQEPSRVLVSLQERSPEPAAIGGLLGHDDGLAAGVADLP